MKRHLRQLVHSLTALLVLIALYGNPVSICKADEPAAKEAAPSALSSAQLAGVEKRAQKSTDIVAQAMDLSEQQVELVKASFLTKYTSNASQITKESSDEDKRAIWKTNNAVQSETLSTEFDKKQIRQINKVVREANEARKLFNGNDLTGWEQVNGTASYEVIDGEIVGTTATGSPNSFLATQKSYANFELQFEVFLVNNELNSGVQFRSAQHTEESLQDSAKKHPVGRVFGYQCEIEASADEELDAKKYGDAGYIYDEARRGWLVDDETRLAAKTRGAFKNQQWNRMKIVANGDRIKTFINGKKICDITDSMTASGFIALQVHGIGKREDKWQVKWRNITLDELP